MSLLSTTHLTQPSPFKVDQQLLEADERLRAYFGDDIFQDTVEDKYTVNLEEAVREAELAGTPVILFHSMLYAADGRLLWSERP